MAKTGYQRLVDLDNGSHQQLLDTHDSGEYYGQEGNGLAAQSPPKYKIIRTQPISASAPLDPFLDNFRRNEATDLESQLLLPHSYQHSPISLIADPVNTDQSGGVTVKRKSSIPRSLSLDLKGINDKVSKWTHSLWTSSPKAHGGGRPIEIQYSVFKPAPDIRPLERLPPGGFADSGPMSSFEFKEIVEDSIRAIDELGIKPVRINAGSSGSYFIYNTNNEIVGVFKPKDEEPYGPLSPKWTKWLHRNLFPCFFGRSCLIPNLGYICESAASLLDRQLRTFIVPFTDVVSISSDSFYYSYWDRKSKKTLPPKIGSFQIFLNGYVEADKFLLKYPFPGSRWELPALYYSVHDVPIPKSIIEIPVALKLHENGSNVDREVDPEFQWTPDVIQQFREELEKLVILDYIMRNTDRGLDNWMIKLEWETKTNGEKHPVIRIGAIDSGLSFPWKHPDEWRSYPFGWLFLPVSIIGQPFSDKTRRHFLPLLTSTKWWEECSLLFRDLFSIDADFKDRMWKKQWGVMKGQAFNVVETLKNPTHGPLELARRTRMLVKDQEMEVSVTVPISIMNNAMNTPLSNANKITKAKNYVKPTSNLDIIDENSRLQDTNNCRLKSVHSHDDDEIQKQWNDLLNGEINEVEFQSPKAQARRAAQSGGGGGGDSSLLNHNYHDMNPEHLDSSAATKMVIIERIQAVTSKPPVFPCC